MQQHCHMPAHCRQAGHCPAARVALAPTRRAARGWLGAAPWAVQAVHSPRWMPALRRPVGVVVAAAAAAPAAAGAESPSEACACAALQLLPAAVAPLAPAQARHQQLPGQQTCFRLSVEWLRARAGGGAAWHWVASGRGIVVAGTAGSWAEGSSSHEQGSSRHCTGAWSKGGRRAGCAWQQATGHAEAVRTRGLDTQTCMQVHATHSVAHHCLLGAPVVGAKAASCHNVHVDHTWALRSLRHRRLRQPLYPASECEVSTSNVHCFRGCCVHGLRWLLLAVGTPWWVAVFVSLCVGDHAWRLPPRSCFEVKALS